MTEPMHPALAGPADVDELPWTTGDSQATRNGVVGRRCRRHEWPKPFMGGESPWPATCLHCLLTTEDPDAYFYPLGWDEEVLSDRERCVGTGGAHELGFRCLRCPAVRDPAASRRGRSSLRAGKDAERAIAKAYPDGKRTGQFGGPDDVTVGDFFVIQSKAGGWFSERVWAELAKLPRSGGRIPTLIVSDRPGPGHRTRRYVVRMIDDDVALHGETP